ncbi:hypothetical protein DN752_18000 [Echinicola strongylocentroti]|uniref:Uncharacterized protein n=1 Tax=Echinicola strongylocentroti TaxID=1795355 RepID=A0A2Z4ILV6_9BACT|nr:ATP-binding protein [Echinicola strongylocentroti]AWW31874.1 hypothetical protein DN752_18000 [Echinicola strongylocentroti]
MADSNTILIYGPKGSGKSRLANKLAEGKKTVRLQDRMALTDNRATFGFSQVTKETECILIDEAFDFDEGQLNALIAESELVIDRKAEKQLIIPRPELIIAFSAEVDPSEDRPKRNVQTIVLNRVNNGHKSNAQKKEVAHG